MFCNLISVMSFHVIHHAPTMTVSREGITRHNSWVSFLCFVVISATDILVTVPFRYESSLNGGNVSCTTDSIHLKCWLWKGKYFQSLETHLQVKLYVCLRYELRGSSVSKESSWTLFCYELVWGVLVVLCVSPFHSHAKWCSFRTLGCNGFQWPQLTYIS